jgi:3,4-dihydroxy 2-butanone 4-phosphate synthase/GTP cyclohydrolase II
LGAAASPETVNGRSKPEMWAHDSTRVQASIAAVSRGEMIVAVDDDSDGEGYLMMAAEFVSGRSIAFFLEHTSGVIGAALTSERARELSLIPMVSQSNGVEHHAFLVTVDVRHGTTTGISAWDRAATITALVDAATRPDDLLRPGHVVPIEARKGGVLKRAGHAEAAVDLAHLAGRVPVVALSPIVSDDRRGMARRPELDRFCQLHRLPLISIAELISYRRRTEKLVKRAREESLRTPWGRFECVTFESELDGAYHIAMVHGAPAAVINPFVRVHSECVAGHVFKSDSCECGRTFAASMRDVADRGAGVVIYLRGYNACKAASTSEADQGIASVKAAVEAQMLTDLGIEFP